jgi:aminopeptidase B
VEHIHLHSVVDVAGRTWTGKAVLRVRLLAEPAAWREPRTLVLDSHDALKVHSAEAAWGAGDAAGVALPVSVAAFTAFGTALHLDLAPLLAVAGGAVPAAGTLLTVTLTYATGGGPSTCWLTPEQTAAKAHPFLFTQGQACLNRSLFPCQDSPRVRTTYSARLLVARPLTALASAHMGNAIVDGRAVGEPLDAADAALLAAAPPRAAQTDAAGWHAFTFTMPHSIPIYLAAFVVGDVSCADIGPRSRVWAEPNRVAAAAYEFGHGGVTEAYLATGERLFGPYRWGRYDIAVLPPSFPYGGMENTCLTFVTPTLLAGDQSLTDVICHEIAHSWFGNLVTNANWGSFWCVLCTKRGTGRGGTQSV